jgi:hypothetical protein
MSVDIEEGIHDTGRFLRMLADEANPMDRRCKCGHILMNAFSLACEVCEPEQLPSLLRQQAA